MVCPNFTFGILVSYSSLLAPFSSLYTLMMSLVTHFCAVKHLKVPNISRADHIPALIEEIPTEVIQNVSNLHKLLLLVLLAVHSVVDLKLT